MDVLIYGMIYLGSALMVYNIYGFIRYARYAKARLKTEKSGLLNIPIFLLIFFLLGYLFVGIFGKPDLMISGILFFGSVFVLIMYRILTAITRRIAENEEKEAKLMAAEESNRAKSSFLASVSHEMRTPMNVIIGADAAALNEPDLSEKTRGQLEKIGLSAKHLLGLINNILDMNQIECGAMSLKAENFTLKSVMDQLDAIIGTYAAEKGVVYTVYGLEQAESVYFGDEVKLTQVLQSILDNAVKFTDAPGNVDLIIEAGEVKDSSRELTFKIRDSGVGIDEEFLPKVFDAFSQEDQSSTTTRSGSGLGLAVTKRIVELMKGTITVESRKHVGSAFTVTLPMKLAEDYDETAAGKKPTDGSISLAGLRVLIVEDMEVNAELVADLLELEEVKSEHAQNGRIAVDMFSASEVGYYDAILMDLRMPVMDGVTAAKEIRKLNRPDAATVPIIAVTANAFESDVRQTREAGMNAHLAKPADAQMLYSTLKYLVGTRPELKK